MVGQVTAAADALSPLDVGAAQQRHRGTLVEILGGKSGNGETETSEALSYVFGK